MKRSKRYDKSRELVDSQKLYGINEAVELLKQLPNTKFDQTVDLTVKVGLTGQKEIIRATVNFPHQFGGSKKVAVFTVGEKAKIAKEAGADFVGGEDLVEKIKGGWLDFDVVMATPDMMALVSKLGKILGPKGLMPNPKNETVTNDLARVIKEIKSGRVDIKSGEDGVMHVGIGKLSYNTEAILENFDAVFTSISKTGALLRLKGVTIAATMSPGIKINPSSIKAGEEN